MHLAQLNIALPAVDEAAARLALLRENGPGPDAFTLREPHPAAVDEISTVAS
jgi:hypothetical protein